MQEMEKIANRIVSYLDTDHAAWNEIERMQMLLGLQVLIHNIVMTGTILFLALLTGMFWEAAILLTTYGALKMTVGGVHFKTSCACLTATTAFVMTGVLVSRRLDIGFMSIVIIFAACFITLMLIGPQGTENNPISKENFEKLRKKAAGIILIYLIITFFMLFENLKNVPCLLLVAVVFETLSVLPSYIKNRSS